jgi:sialate O-acetylesterase
MRRSLPVALLLLAICLTKAAAQEARPFLSPMFTDNMVLQRNISVPVWGWTDPGKEVTVSIAGKRARVTAGADGKWMAKIGPLPVGGPYAMAVAGPRNVMLNNVLVGDVWVCSGQSNMEWGIKAAANPDQEIAAANYPEIRLFTVQKTIALEPKTTVNGRWDVCTPQTIAQGGMGFSAVAYFFGRHLHNELKVPIGLIHTSWGGTVAEAWASESALETMPDMVEHLARYDVLRKRGTPGQNPNVTSVLYNGMIAPIIPYGIKGAIWYQGESNAGRAYQYRTLLPVMINDWRYRWGVGEFPFLIVQLANFMAEDPEPKSDPWPELREAQYLTTKTVPNAGLAVAIDIGDAKDIHPKNKQEVGRRLALSALALAYHKKGQFSGPVYKSMKREGNRIRLSFDYLGGGLQAKNGQKLTGFAIAGKDRKFVWADAAIEGNTVVVSSQQVADPVAVRYAWGNNPLASLYNKTGLPAVPFRTDDWPGVTMGRK